MNLKSIAIGVLTAIFVILIAAVAMLFLATPDSAGSGSDSASALEVKSFQQAGDQGYALFAYQGKGNATLLSMEKKPSKKVFIYNDPQAVGATKLDALAEQLKALEQYGYEVGITNTSAMGEGIYVVPTGAIPVFILAKLKNNYSAGTILYMGDKDLILSSGIKKLDWFAELDESQKEKLVVYGGTLDDYIDKGESYLIEDILYEKWNARANRTVILSGDGLSSATVPMEDGRYLRLIYSLGTGVGAEDSGLLAPNGITLAPAPDVIYPWQKSDLQYSLGKTNGTAKMTIELLGESVLEEELARVTDENVFVKRLKFEEAGDYVITVSDNSGPIGSGILHVNDLRIYFMEQTGTTYKFYLTSDGRPLNNVDTFVSLAGSTDKQKFYVSEGFITLRANAEPGLTTFDFGIYDGVVPVQVETRSSNPLDFYIKWGIPALLIIAVVYFGARLSRRPVYVLRFGESGNSMRQEVQISAGEVTDLVSKTREDLHIEGMPITPQEYTVSLRRHITNGADVTEGNVEGIFKRLVAKGVMDNHREYYQLSGEGDIRKNALRRMIKEKLIENGVMYKESAERFVTQDFEIGFFGSKFKKKGIIIFDDESEVRRTLSSLSEKDLVELRMKQANDLLILMPIERLSDVL